MCSVPGRRVLDFLSDSWILSGSKCCRGRSECLGAGWGVRNLYFRFLWLAAQDSAEQAFSHVDPSLTLRRCSPMTACVSKELATGPAGLLPLGPTVRPVLGATGRSIGTSHLASTRTGR